MITPQGWLLHRSQQESDTLLGLFDRIYDDLVVFSVQNLTKKMVTLQANTIKQVILYSALHKFAAKLTSIDAFILLQMISLLVDVTQTRTICSSSFFHSYFFFLTEINFSTNFDQTVVILLVFSVVLPDCCPVSEMTYTVSSVTLNSTILYHTRLLRAQPAYSAMHKKTNVTGKMKLKRAGFGTQAS